jgi:hypothetical protein
VDIALVSTVDRDGNVTPKPIIIEGSNTKGRFSVTGGIVADEELYHQLELTNYNLSNPNRDTSIEPMFKRVDEVADSKHRSKKRSALLEALTYVKNLTDGEVKDTAAGLNWNETLPVEVLRDMLEAFAEKDAVKFIEHIENKDQEVKSTLKKAITAGKINYDTTQHRIVLPPNQTLIKLDRVDGVDYLTQAAEYILHNAKGAKVYETIKKLMTSNPSDK